MLTENTYRKSQFIAGSETSPQVDILVEELDSLDIKIMLREEAKKRHIPVVMVTDTENTVIDVERYDVDPDLSILHGLIGNTHDFYNFPRAEMVKMVTRIIGAG